MYLTEAQLKVLARVMQTLAEPHEEAAIRARLGALMLQLLGAQYYASFVWDAASGTFGNGVHLNMDSSNLLRYQRYYQFHDPITSTMQQHRSAVLVSDVMPRAGLVQTEFFNDFLARDGLHWGINLYAWSGQHNIGDMRIWRDRRRADFGHSERELLDLVRPAFVAALQRCRPPDVPGGSPAVASELGTVRSSPLSARELDVARLAACGLADKEIASRLGIAPTTVRTHLDHAFLKLKVDNRIRLANKLATLDRAQPSA
jgi:DNA-binding CsgD family transcriptional regulator